MTNYRHAKMIDIIGKMDSPKLRVHKDRCMLVRNRNSECLRCAAVCTTGAISRSEIGVSVNPDLCIGCGTCASACPTCCLEANNPSDDELFAGACEASRRGGGTLVVVCEKAQAALGVPRGRGAIAELGNEQACPAVAVICLGRVDESLLVESAARGTKSVVLAHGACDSCAHESGARLSAQMCQSARNLFKAMGIPCTIRRIDAQDIADSVTIGKNPKPHAQEPEELHVNDIRDGKLAERFQSRTVATDSANPNGRTPPRFDIGPNTRTALRPGQNKSFTPQFAHVQADGTLPHHVPQRRLRLYNCLKRFSSPKVEYVSTRLWGHASVDIDSCRSCRMCTVFCPTGALARYDDEDGGFGIEHRSTLCMQCRMCEIICPEQAIEISERVRLADFLAGTVERFELNPVGWNPGASDSIVTRVARFIKTNNLQDPQAKMNPELIAQLRN